MTHGQRLNASIRTAGVVWHGCDGCGNDWPFPKGSPVADNREWHCASCTNAAWARLRRSKANTLAFVRAIGEISTEEAIAAIEKEWQ